jgi:chondroitin AC lyase
VTKDVFAVWLDHGVRPQKVSYEYIVVPGTDVERLRQYAKGHIPITVLANTPAVQAVRHEGLGISEIVFYTPGRQSLRQGLTVAVDQPCMVLLHESGGSAKLAVSSPRGPLRVNVAFTLPGGTKTITVDLRGRPALGASHIQEVGLK